MALHGFKLDDFIIDLTIEMHLRMGVDINRAIREICTMREEVDRYQAAFFQRYGFKIEFTPEAFAEVVKKSIEEHVSALKVCETMSKEFEYAFRLIQERTGEERFILNGEAVRNTQSYLNDLIKRRYAEYSARDSLKEGNAI